VLGDRNGGCWEIRDGPKTRHAAKQRIAIFVKTGFYVRMPHVEETWNPCRPLWVKGLREIVASDFDQLLLTSLRQSTAGASSKMHCWVNVSREAMDHLAD
jgi:hypothetical protein